MSTTMVRQTSFALGQVDQVNWRRTDLKGYLSATQKMQNMEASTTAICRKRRGFQKLATLTTFANDFIEAFEFQDKNGQFYVIFAQEEEFHIYNANTWEEVQTVDTPYAEPDLIKLDYAQDNDVLIFALTGYPLARLFVDTYTPAVHFTYEEITIYPQPAYDFGLIDYSGFAVTFTAGNDTSTLVFTGMLTDPGFTSAWIGGQVIGLGLSGDSPAGYGIITAVAYDGGAHTTTFTIRTTVLFASPNGENGSQYIIRQPVFTEEFGYPNTVLVYQNRLWIGGNKSLPITLFGSRLNEFFSFDVGLARDTDAIIFKIGVPNTGDIVNLNAGKQLEVYTENNELVCPQEAGTGLTPGTLAIRQQTSYGSTRVFKPITYLNDSFYSARAGKAIMQFHFDGIGQAYRSYNVSQYCANLVNQPIDRALQRANTSSQDNYMYILNDDGSVTSFQFDTGYKIASLSPIVFQNDISCLNFVTINNQIMAVMKLSETSEYQIWGLSEDVFMDGFFDVSVDADRLITGLDAYDGYTLTFTKDGEDYGDYVVEDGEVTLSDDSPASVTVTAGFLYPVDLQTMYIFAGKNLMDAYKLITKIYVDYFNSLDFEVDGVTVPYQDYVDIQDELPLTPQTGQYAIGSAKGFRPEQTISITQLAPYDLQIQSISYQVTARLI